jgi:uncharacterized membrane protein YwaF
MHTVMVVLGGFLLLGICLLAGRLTKTMAVAALIFIPIWLGAALINMWIGVSRAGYSVAEELPVFLAVFAIPAVAALFIWWKFS